jgi:hypothetical protein
MLFWPTYRPMSLFANANTQTTNEGPRNRAGTTPAGTLQPAHSPSRPFMPSRDSTPPPPLLGWCCRGTPAGTLQPADSLTEPPVHVVSWQEEHQETKPSGCHDREDCTQDPPSGESVYQDDAVQAGHLQHNNRQALSSAAWRNALQFRLDSTTQV